MWGLPVWEQRCHARVVNDPKQLARVRSFRRELYNALGLRQDSYGVACQAAITNGWVVGDTQGRWSRTMALRMCRNLRMHATMATFWSFPRVVSWA